MRNDATIGGGALLDIGCYPISQARFLFDDEPERVLGLIVRDPSFGPVDQYSCQADAFGAAIRSTRPAPTPLSDAIANMTVIDAVFASAASGGWCAVC